MSHRLLFSSLLLLAFALSPVLAADKEPAKPDAPKAPPKEVKKDTKKDAITDAAQAGPDFALQGEYEGKIGDATYGVHIIALGDDKFDVVLYTGGLPGAPGGWKRGDKKEKYPGALKDGAVAFTTGEIVGSAKNGAMTLGPGQFKKVERKSPTLGAKPPAGAKVLFDGNANEFSPGKTTTDGLLAHGQTSKHKFTKSFTLHLEFRLCYQPYARGQGRSNSGVHLSGGSEVQVLDSFGLEGKNNECGGFYSKREPDVNMCLPPLSWQTYDIEVTVPAADAKDAKTVATVTHNGVVIHKDVPIDFKNGGTLNLQDHGNPVAYRNIWVVEK